MPRKGKKARLAVAAKLAATASPDPSPQKVKKGNQRSASTLVDVDDSPAKHTRLQEQQQTDSTEQEAEFKPRKSMCRVLTQDEEDDLVAWLRENTFLYDKSSAEFKLKEKKNRTWADKEAALGLKPGDLSTIWYPNMRTQFSKLIKASNKSGSGSLERTARQRWILDNFGFLRPYLIQLRTQRGSKFAEKRKELTYGEEACNDDISVASTPSLSPSTSGLPKAAQVVSSLTSELESVRSAITGAHDAAAQTGQFLVHLTRQMDEQRRNSFTTRVTRMALDLVDETHEERRQAAQQTAAPVFAVPAIPTPTYRLPVSQATATGSAEGQQIHQDFQLATNIAALAPPAHLTPMMHFYNHLQPPNVQPTFLQQPLGSFSSTASVTLPNTSAVVRRAMDVTAIPSTSFSQETIGGTSDIPQDLPQ